LTLGTEAERTAIPSTDSVGIGFKVHDLVGDNMMVRRTWSCEQAASSVNERTSRAISSAYPSGLNLVDEILDEVVSSVDDDCLRVYVVVTSQDI